MLIIISVLSIKSSVYIGWTTLSIRKYQLSLETLEY